VERESEEIDFDLLAIAAGIAVYGGGEVLGHENSTPSHQDGTLDHVLEFANIAGIGIVLEDEDGFIGKADVRKSVLFAVDAEKVLSERNDVRAAFAERGHRNAHDVEAVIKIFAKYFFTDAGFEVAVGGGNGTEITVNGFGAADALEGAFLKDAQELGLKVGREFTDFVEENGAAFGQFETTGLAGDGAGESAAFVAEQLGLKKVFGQGGAVDDDKGLVFALAVMVNGLGDEFLAGAGLAADEDGGIGLGYTTDHDEDVEHGTTDADETAGAGGMRRSRISAKADHFPVQGGMVEGALGGEQDFVKVERLSDEAVGAETNSLDGGVAGAKSSNDNDGGGGETWLGAEELKELLAAELRHLPVAEDEVGSFGLKKVDGGRAVVGFQDGIATRDENFCKGFAKVGLVVDDENFGGHRV